MKKRIDIVFLFINQTGYILRFSALGWAALDLCVVLKYFLTYGMKCKYIYDVLKK